MMPLQINNCAILGNMNCKIDLTSLSQNIKPSVSIDFHRLEQINKF